MNTIIKLKESNTAIQFMWSVKYINHSRHIKFEKRETKRNTIMMRIVAFFWAANHTKRVWKPFYHQNEIMRTLMNKQGNHTIVTLISLLFQICLVGIFTVFRSNSSMFFFFCSNNSSSFFFFLFFYKRISPTPK